MRTVLYVIAILFATNLFAQTTPNENCELPRQAIKPYAAMEEPSADNAPTRYISPLTEWQRTDAEGNATFSTTFVYPAAWLNRQLLLRVESASKGYTVVVNGAEVGHTTNATNPAEFNLTRKSQQGINQLQIVIPSSNPTAALLTPSAPSLGKAAVISQPTIRVRDVDYSTRLNDSGDAVAEFNIVIKTDALNPKSSRIHYELFAPDTTRLAYGYKDITLEMRGEDSVSFATVAPAKWLWSIHNPTLLRLVVRNEVEGRCAEKVCIPIGLRQVVYGDKKLSVNGKPVALRVAEVEASISAAEIADLKVQGYNAVVAPAGVAADALYARCDSAGIYAIPQLAVDTSHGANHIKRDGNPSNDPQWKEFYLTRNGEMYHTSKAHPAVVAFSLGGGQTNGINLYECYLMLKDLEPSRPILFFGAGGQWNNDTVEGSIMPAKAK